MPFYGSIVVIKRSGSDGSLFPLVSVLIDLKLEAFFRTFKETLKKPDFSFEQDL